MRLIKVQFAGYKRLRDTGCNMDGKIIALVGPNEAGKSSVLEGLTWLWEGGALPGYMRTRNSVIADDVPGVRATYLLSEDDIKALEHLEVENLPNRFVLVRTLGGDRQTGAYPKATIRRSLLPDTTSSLMGILEVVRKSKVSDPDMGKRLFDAVKEAIKGLDLAKNSAPDDLSLRVDLAVDLLGSLVRGKLHNDDELFHQAIPVRNLGMIESALSILVRFRSTLGVNLDNEVRAIMASRLPSFILFSEEDRTLRTSYDLADEELRSNPPRALVNLLETAGSDVQAVFSAIQSGDTTRLKTLIRRLNKKLGKELKSSWRQSDLSLEIDTDATQLQVLINEEDEEGTLTVIQERSEGLRTFVALLCFFAIRKEERPKILLIDEAETHLHVDAQADLVNMLTRQSLAQQVIYTTHSPACLPADLGSGVRLVEPSATRPGTSRLTSSFWQKNIAGFNPLLFAMGAGAAAFSVCREAVLCEGPSEMILLPRLIREAVGLDRVPFQVAPGLSLIARGDGEFRYIASKVVYLVDGDSGGRSLRAMLLDDSGISDTQIVSFSEGIALEDLLDRQSYLDTVLSLLRDSNFDGPLPGHDALDGPGTVAKNLEKWAKRSSCRLPSKVAVAVKMASLDEQKTILSASGSEELRRVYALVEIVLQSFN
jgi:predicted ATP-dependent endonuclease of OLD family